MSDDQGNEGGDPATIPGLPPRPHRGWTFDEHPVGKRWSTSRRTITETDLVVYATQFGFGEGLFLDATASERAGYSGRRLGRLAGLGHSTVGGILELTAGST